MAVIWGLDLKEIQWGKFKNSYMWNTEYHMRRTKFVIYQLAMILCVVSESLGTAALDDYVTQQKFVTNLNSNATVHNNNYVGIASFNIFVGIYVATIFGAAFFFDLFWPERQESRSVKLAWKLCSVFACMLTLACALAYTDIVATRSAYVSGVDAGEARRLLEAYNGSPMRYRDNGRAVASVVFLWPGMVFTFASTYILWRSIDHIDRFGPKSTHARTRDEVVKPDTEKALDNESAAGLSHAAEKPHEHEATPYNNAGGATLRQPEQLHVRPEGHHEGNVGALNRNL